MHLFVLYLVVHFVNEVDLWDPADHWVHDRAAETAKLIDIVQKTDKFEVKYPLKSNDRAVEKGKDDVDIFETMKLLQKNYDVNRKFNVLPKEERLQYISNPEVLETYKNLGDSEKQQTEAYDDLDSHGSTLRSYFNELTDLRYFRTNNKNRTEKGSVKIDDKDTADTKEVNKRRHIGEEQNSEDKGTASDSSHSPENSEAVNKYNEAFNLVKPIVAEMLSKYVIKNSQEKRMDVEKYGAPNNPVKRKLPEKGYRDTESDSKDKDTQTKASEFNTKIKRFKKLEQVASLTSGEQKKKEISTETFNIDPTITIEHSASEEIKKYPANQNSYGMVKSKQFTNMETDHNINVELKRKKTKIQEENARDKSSGRVSMEEHIINWSDYDENKNKYKEEFKIDDEKSSKKNKNVIKRPIREKVIKNFEKNIDSENEERLTSIENKKEDIKPNLDNKYKLKVSTQRKGDWDEKDDNWDRNYDDKKDDNNFQKKVIDWDKKEDDSQKLKDWKPKNSRIEKDDYDSNKKKVKNNKKQIDWNKKDDDWDKKDDDWNKSDDKYDKKDDAFSKKVNKWNKKDDDYYSKEEKKKVKQSNWKNNDDDGNLKRDGAWDSVGTNKKQNSGWGSYDSFKNILEEKNKNVKHIARPVDIPRPKLDIKMPKPSSWDSYDRDSHYNKPKKQGRMGMHRTPIPIVGKRPLYAD
ncbi:unnamed protein product [Arctia plantaginis]|uniref:Uncharacterized protein n=1 Tax=Arctia plantaginis TaxID=874455 RepID=A0A8S1BGG5_ARCPL|nr:unnamed protein product [Arctia plantaginis]